MIEKYNTLSLVELKAIVKAQVGKILKSRKKMKLLCMKAYAVFLRQCLRI